MTYDEAVNVLAVMMAAWPQMERMTNNTGQLWASDLQELDLEAALTTIDRMRHVDEYPPTLARFLGAYQAVKPRDYHQALPAGQRDTTISAPIVKALKEQLKHITRADHANHHKQAHVDCPVCSLHDYVWQGGRWTHHGSCRRCHALGQVVFDAYQEGRLGEEQVEPFSVKPPADVRRALRGEIW